MKLVCQHCKQPIPVQSNGIKRWMIGIIILYCDPTTSPIPCAKCAVQMILKEARVVQW